MNTERLKSVLYDLVAEFEAPDLKTLLNNFNITFNQSISQANAQTSEAFGKAREALWNKLKEAPINSLPPSQTRILTEIGGDAFFGNGLMYDLQAIIDENTATPGQAVIEIKKLIQEAIGFHSTVKAANEALENLTIQHDFTQKGEYEVGVLFPSKLFDNNIDDLGTELHVLNNHLKSYGEIAGEDTSNPTIRDISDGSIELFLNALPAVAECIAESIEHIVILYLSILQIRKHRKELKEEKVPDTALKAIVDFEKQRLEKDLQTIADSLFKKYRKKGDKNRDEELKGHLLNALKYLAKRIDQGADFEVTPPSQFDELKEDATESQKKKAESERAAAKKLLIKGQSVMRLPEREHEVLSLAEPKKTPEDKK